MSEQAEGARALGEAGETCRKCVAPLAADQRYCLNCGCRRGGPRVDFHEHLPAGDAAATNGSAPPPGPAAAPPTVPPPADERPQRDYAPLAAVGGIAVLGLMLLVGVLIGKGDNGSSSPPPQVVRVQGGGGAASASEEAGGGEESTSKAAKAKGAAKKAEDAGGLLGGKGSGPVQASDDALRELEEQSPDEYSENSAKLPDEIATGGAPPPEDGKTPGGGSKGTAIE